MIKHVSIRNFKSIKQAELDCGRVNIFIGEPNSGKTNILEGIGILSYPFVERLEEIIRFEDFNNLFFDKSINQDVLLEFEATQRYSDNNQDSNELISQKVNIKYNKLFDLISTGQFVGCNFNIEYGEKHIYHSQKDVGDSPIKFYNFNKQKNYIGKELKFLYPPYGSNLIEILKINSELRIYANSLFENYGYKILLDTDNSKLLIVKIVDGVLISQPFYMVADTLQRILFYIAIIETNKDSSIVLDEPDVYLFPKYTKYLAERIAKYNSNQFFLTTHNPYFLLTLAEKTPAEDLRVFLTYYEDYQTKVKLLSPKEVLDLRDEDASLFFNLENYRD